MIAILFRYARVLLIASIASSSWAAHSHFPNSEWTLDVSRSDFGGGPSVRSDVVTIATDTESRISYTEFAVGTDGAHQELHWEGPQDGSLHPMRGMSGAFAAFTTADDSGHFVYPDGTSTENWFWVSVDGRTLTYHVVGLRPDHSSFSQTLVYDKTK